MSHKVLRWLAPFFMIAMLATSLLLWRLPLFRIASLLQLTFYLLAAIGWVLQNRQRNFTLFSIPFYFCLVNAASLAGCLKCLRGDLSGVWTPPRQKEPSKA
jgi:hypothetical protein